MSRRKQNLFHIKDFMLSNAKIQLFVILKTICVVFIQFYIKSLWI